MKFRFLGTGTSVGVPQIGCDCPVCTSSDPRDRRRRCGAYVAQGELGVLIDTPPEMRLSCCEYGVKKVDAVLLTHAHMDHVAGFDDVRRFNTINGEVVPCAPDEPGANGRTCRVVGKVMPVYATSETEEQMHRIFPYISEKGGDHGLFRPQVRFLNDDAFTIGDGPDAIEVERLEVEHGKCRCCGYLLRARGRRTVYISDCHVLPERTVERAAGADVLVLNCLRDREHPTHLSTERAVEYCRRIGAKRSLLIHMCHDFSHEEWLERLPAGIEPAYDGQLVET
ncbi:MAG: MBL fold metallo-hydrolase [Clostridia bacterium]|nr:MBL fold metallo-hydrolase [Clostridia bacterium]